MTEVVVGHAADFPEGTHKVVHVGRRAIGVFNIGGRFYGLPNVCPHQAGPLCTARRTTGTLIADAAGDWRVRWEHEGEVIACPWHGLEFHVPTGRCFADPRLSVRVFEVSLRGDDVVVRL